jgi:ubiquitin carboxyl-terminal hydrolase 25/28
MAHFKDIAAFTTELATKADRPELKFFQRLDAEAAAMESKRSEVKARISQLKSDIERLWEDVSQADYELVSVFMHRGASASQLSPQANLRVPGEANFGHYWLHQRALPKEPDRYFKFNDAQVTDLPAEEVFADTTGQTNNPYWLSEPGSFRVFFGPDARQQPTCTRSI